MPERGYGMDDPNMERCTAKGGGLGKMFSRAFTGESMFQNHYTAKGGQGMIAFASAVPGDHAGADLAGAFHCGTEVCLSGFGSRCQLELFFQKKLAGGFFGGEGFIMQKFFRNGMLFLEVDGSMVAYDLARAVHDGGHRQFGCHGSNLHD